MVWLYLQTGNVRIEVLVNSADLKGELKAGARFTGEIWLQGYILSERELESRYEGIDVAIIFGTRVALSVNGLRDKELAGVLCRAVNRWLLEEYLPIDPKRLKGVGLIPCQDPPAAVKELERLIQQRQRARPR